jgi:hypothetical protein
MAHTFFHMPFFCPSRTVKHEHLCKSRAELAYEKEATHTILESYGKEKHSKRKLAATACSMHYEPFSLSLSYYCSCSLVYSLLIHNSSESRCHPTPTTPRCPSVGSCIPVFFVSISSLGWLPPFVMLCRWGL